MKENIIIKKSKTKILLKITISFILLLTIFLSMQGKNIIGKEAAFAAEVEQSESEENEKNENVEKDYIYLSDIKYIANQSSVGWGSITLDRNLESKYNNGLITLIVDGQKKQFFKGI